jgi:hypothetical protein
MTSATALFGINAKKASSTRLKKTGHPENAFLFMGLQLRDTEQW